MSAAQTEALRRDILNAKRAIEYAEEAIVKGQLATCSYELEAAAHLVKSARKATAQAMRERIAAEEKKEIQKL